MLWQKGLLMSGRKKFLFALITVGVFFLVLELGLVAIGVQTADELTDPYVGFSSYSPLMEQVTDDSGQRIFQTADNKLVWFNDQQFPVKKADGTRRVFCLGGSTTNGRPYDDSTSYSRWLRELLPIADEQHDWEVINCGGVSFASYRVAMVMQELADYQPDLFIIYTAQNEFLERRTYANLFQQSGWTRDAISLAQKSRMWSLASRLVRGKKEKPKTTLPAEVDEILNHTIGPIDYERDEKWRGDVLNHYQANLQRMVQIAERCGAKIVFVTAASNEKDSTPFKSQWSDDVSEKQQQAFDLKLKEGSSLLRDKQYDLARKMFSEIAEEDSLHAGLLYRLGRSEFALGNYDQAREAFHGAIEQDICPLRAPTGVNQAIRKTAAEHDLALVDFEKRLREKSKQELGHDIFGHEYFLDHVHPTLEIHQQLSIWILDTLIERGLIDGDQPTDQQIAAVDERIRAGIDREKHGLSMRNLSKVLHWAGKFEEAMPRALDALELIENDAESMRVLADCQRVLGDTDGALATYERLFVFHPLYFPAYLNCAELLIYSGRYGQAEPLAASILKYYPAGGAKDVRASHAYATCCVELGNYEEAMKYLSYVLEKHPNDLAMLAYLAKTQAGMGQYDESKNSYFKAVDVDPNDGWTHRNFGTLLIRRKEYADAVGHLERAVEIDENDRVAKSQLEIAKKLLAAEQ